MGDIEFEFVRSVAQYMMSCQDLECGSLRIPTDHTISIQSKPKQHSPIPHQALSNTPIPRGLSGVPLPPAAAAALPRGPLPPRRGQATYGASASARGHPSGNGGATAGTMGSSPPANRPLCGPGAGAGGPHGGTTCLLDS